MPSGERLRPRGRQHREPVAKGRRSAEVCGRRPDGVLHVLTGGPAPALPRHDARNRDVRAQGELLLRSRPLLWPWLRC